MAADDNKMKEDPPTCADAEMKDVTTTAAGKKGDDADAASKEFVVAMPPLEAAAWRLEKLLQKKENDYYSNPAKIVRRWLSTSSGAAGEASLGGISKAVLVLFDPETSHLDLLKHHHDNVDDDNEKMQEDAPTTKEDQDKKKEETEGKYLKSAATEVFLWLWSLRVRILWRANKVEDAGMLCEKGILFISDKLQASNAEVASLSSLYPLLARFWRFLGFVLPNGGSATPQLRVHMARAHNLALLRRDVDTAATLLNAMMRDFMANSQVEQAQKLLSNSTFPESATNNQFCRYLYYSGRTQALRLEYTESFSSLSQSLRKAPTNTALGFRTAVQRLLVVVQLLMGEIPDRQVFYQKGMRNELLPYLEITQAVRRGDLAVFTSTVAQHKERLQADETFTLISRLAHQVVKAGLRKLQLSYSRLSLQDVADRLGLASAKQAEFVVAKAVRDGVLDATIHHEEGYVQSHDLINIYATKEPAQAFHRRIAYCLTTHNDAVRAMRYPPDAYKKQLEASRGHRRKRGKDDKTDEEKAQELEDELEEDY